jgi:iron(III) transport system substrate-binding protein
MTGINVAGITYNTSIVGKNVPKDWKDLLRPELKGKIAVADPRNVPTFMALFRILKDELGPDYLKALADQNLIVVPSAVPGTQQMAAGEFAIVFPNTLAVVAPVKAQGGPVDFAGPPLTTGVEYWTMLSAGARAPNAAKCLYNFLFTKAGQKGFNGTTSVSPFPDVEGTADLPTTYRSLDTRGLAEQEKEILSLLKLR